MRRRALLLASLVALGAAGVSLSGAAFTASHGNAGNSFAAAADWTAPSVSMTDPGGPLKGQVTLGATASDPISGLASVRIERRPAGGSTWTEVCAGTSSPLSCPLDTASGATPDGLFDFRAVAADAAGNSATSAVVSDRRIDNTAPTVTLADPGDMSATVTLSSTVGDPNGSGVTSVRYEYAPTGGTSWAQACTSAAAPFSCSFATSSGSIPDGRYDLRAIATDAANNSTTSTTVVGRWVDNAAPTSVTMGDPGTLLTGSKTFSGTAADVGSGVASLRFQYRPAGNSTWSDACSATTSPYSCAFATGTLADGDYDFRALAVDHAGKQTASSVHAGRKVDNTGPTVTVSDPGGYLSGNAAVLSATAGDGAGTGVTSVKIQYRPLGTQSWTDACTDTDAPYSCTLNTKSGGTPDGSYELRAVAADGAGLSTNSPIVSVVVDNTRPRGSDLQSENGGATAGIVEPGDKLHLFYTETMKASSLLSGWDGSATTVTLRFTNQVSGDKLEIYDAANTTRLHAHADQKPINLVGDYVPSSGAVFSATMVRSGTTVSFTLGSRISGSVNSLPAAVGTMEWNPSSLSTDLAGNQCETATIFELVLETGALDREF